MDGLISTRTYGLIELGLTFGGVLVFCVYQIWSVRRIDRREAAKAAARSAGGDGDPAAAPVASRENQPADGRRGIR